MATCNGALWLGISGLGFLSEKYSSQWPVPYLWLFTQFAFYSPCTSRRTSLTCHCFVTMTIFKLSFFWYLSSCRSSSFGCHWLWFVKLRRGLFSWYVSLYDWLARRERLKTGAGLDSRRWILCWRRRRCNIWSPLPPGTGYRSGHHELSDRSSR